LLCYSDEALGHGAMRDIYDIVMVDIGRFDRSRSQDVAHDVAVFNEKLVAQGRPFVLIGVGRWGSLDPWLGIPVKWNQISGARAIVESGFKDVSVDPSQGSHFFHNITSFNVGYFTVDYSPGHGFIDWEWLQNQPSEEETALVRHVRLARPLVVRLNGHQSKGVILKPE
jgi:hypothetical protein